MPGSAWPCHILLVYPAIPPDTYWSFKYALRLIRRKSALPPLGLVTVAAMLPEEIDLRLVDLNFETLDDGDLDWADMVFVSAMRIQQSGVAAIIAAARRRSVPVVVGGALATATPEDLAGADYLLQGEVEASIDLAADAQLLEGMHRAGFNEVFIGIETPSTRALAETGKHHNLKADPADAIAVIQRAGLEVMGGFIVGFDSDGTDIFVRQVRFIQQAGIPQAMVGLLTALPGTRLFERLRTEGRILQAASGNNTHSFTTNFRPRMGADNLRRGYRRVLATLYGGNLANFMSSPVRCSSTSGPRPTWTGSMTSSASYSRLSSTTRSWRPTGSSPSLRPGAGAPPLSPRPRGASKKSMWIFAMMWSTITKRSPGASGACSSLLHQSSIGTVSTCRRSRHSRALSDGEAIMPTNTILATLRGLLALSVYTLNTLFWCVFLFAAAILKLIVPAAGFRCRCSAVLNFIAVRWIAVNNFNMRLISRTRIRARGIEALRAGNWYLVISNHQSWVDILVLQNIFHRRIPFLKFFIKKELIWMPVLGLAWWALDFPFVKRYSRQTLARKPHLRGHDIEITRKACAKFCQLPVSIMNFVEGTRHTAAKSRAQQSPYRHLLRPKSGGIALVLQTMGAQMTSVLDVTIVYPQGAPRFWDLVCGRLEDVHVHVREIPIRRVPAGDYFGDPEFRPVFQEWVNDLWLEKDARIQVILEKNARNADGTSIYPRAA
ncbi:MAG: acetyltransferase [Desulfobacterales bacterium]|nr:acetyltransferase [Desulfobacterales bacterium]